MRVKEENEKAGLKLNIHKTKIMASSPITSWQIELEKWKQWQILYSWVPKLLLAVIAAMKLKDTCSLEGKLWQTFVIQLLSVSDSLWSHGLQHTRFPILHYVPDFAQTHVHWVNDAIQSSHPLSPPSPPALSLSQHHGLFQWVSSLHQVAKVLEFQRQHQSFTVNIQDWFPLRWTGLTSLQSKGFSRVFSNTTVQKHQFFGTQLSL